MKSNTSFHQRLSVPFDYPVQFTRRLFDPANPTLVRIVRRLKEHRRHRVFVCIDAGVLHHNRQLAPRIKTYFKRHADTLELAGAIETANGGESIKHGLASVNRAIRWMATRHLDRHSFVMIVGGGSVLDAVGLAASLVHRGLRVIRVPTTVTAQNDVGVGVKTGIDAYGAKNFLGTFAPPFAVLNDLDFLDTLPLRDQVAGIAEAFKVAMIKDRRFFRQLCRQAPLIGNGDTRIITKAVIRCARLHLDHIRTGGDPFETGSARPLDFGHWSAHHLETASHFKLRHGEAVSIGIALDAIIAADLNLLARRDALSLINALRTCGLPVWHPLLESRNRYRQPRILEGLKNFQEHLGGELTLTLPGPLGSKMEIHTLPADLLLRALQTLKNLSLPLPPPPRPTKATCHAIS
jgi:3-dehydroquinate synthase